jgi:iron complex outermembrane receptor protein
MKSKHSYSLMLLATLGLIPAGIAWAADAATENSGLEEVTVTAQRRAENLQTVPLAVTAFSAAALHDQGIDSIKDITERVPGLTMGQFNAGQPQIYIRGVGTNVRGAAEDPGVIVFVDEVYIARAQGSDIDLFDLERAEVLRGPQGTLFGRNVIGGAISLITTKPGPDTKWGLEGSFGDFKSVSGRGYASGELGNNLFGKIAFSGKSRDSYLINHIGDFPTPLGVSRGFAQNKLQGDSSQSIRGQLRYQPSDAVDINLTLHFSSQDADGAIRHFGAGPTGGVFYVSDSTLIPGYANDYRNVLVDDPGQYRSQAYGANLRFDVDLNDSLLFTSLTAYRFAKATEIEPGLGSPALSALRLNGSTAAFTLDGNNDYFDRDKMLTQEFRLASKGDGKLKWVAGLFYLDQDVYRDETATIAIKTRGTAGAIVGTNTFGDEIQLASNKSYALFGQASYAISDQWSATLGVRYTHDKKDFRGIGDPGGLTINEAYDVTGSKSWSATTPKGSIEFKPSSNAMIYLSAAKGYKAGGFPNLGPTAVVARTAYDPEKALQYEIGAKTEWFDRRLRVNVAAFDIKYDDLQVLLQLIPVGAPAGTPGVLFTLNAADSKSKGAEVEFSVAPTDRWLISGSFATLDAKFTSFFVPPGYNLPSGATATANNGKYLRNAPKQAYNLLVRYTQPLSNGGQLSLQADTRHKDKVYSDPANQEFAAIPAYSLTDLRVGYTTPKGNVEIAAALTNAGNEKYLLHAYPSLGMGLQVAGPPRMASISFTIRN